MKKPEYIEIRLPGRKSTFSSARRKYLKRLETKVLEINFGKHRERKIFEYLVRESQLCQYRDWGAEKEISYWVLKIELKVPKGDHEKVL